MAKHTELKTASVLLFDHSGNKIVRVHNSKTGKWEDPGGKIEDGESVMDAMCSVITLSASSVITLHINRLCTVK